MKRIYETRLRGGVQEWYWCSVIGRIGGG